MNMLVNTIKWDIKLILRYNIGTIAAVITAIYCIVFIFVNTTGFEKLISLLVFSDPVMYGYLFVSVMILFEKDSNTHLALGVTQQQVKIYILSKNITFTLLALVSSIVMIIAAQPAIFNTFVFVSAVILSSSLFVFIGIISVARVKNFNQFIMVIPMILAPVCIPFLDYFNLIEALWVYVIPTQACLILFEGSITDHVGFGDYFYAYGYLLILNISGYRFALQSYFRHILKISRHE